MNTYLFNQMNNDVKLLLNDFKDNKEYKKNNKIREIKLKNYNRLIPGLKYTNSTKKYLI